MRKYSSRTFYDELQFRQGSLNKYYELLDEKKGHDRANKVVGAFLSELVKEGTLQASNLKVGSGPVYFLPEQPPGPTGYD